MSTELLRRAATQMREKGADPFCSCEGETDHWFDRSICPEPCGSMHDICTECARVKGRCPVATEGVEPSPFTLAVADMLENAAEDADMQAPGGDLWAHWDMRVNINTQKALAVARTYLGEPT